MLAMLGFSNRLIRNQTGRSDGWIQSTLRREGVKRIQYRDGRTALPKAIVYRANEMAERKLLTHLEKHLLK